MSPVQGSNQRFDIHLVSQDLMGPCNPNLDFIDTLTPPAAVKDPRGFAEMVHARLNAGWDFSSPNFRFVADQNAAVTRAFDVTATTPHPSGITPPAGAWRRGGSDGINCTTGDVTRHQTVAVRGSWHIAISFTSNQKLRRVLR